MIEAYIRGLDESSLSFLEEVHSFVKNDNGNPIEDYSLQEQVVSFVSHNNLSLISPVLKQHNISSTLLHFLANRQEKILSETTVEQRAILDCVARLNTLSALAIIDFKKQIKAIDCLSLERMMEQ
jgi:hypothetical protein